MTEIRGGPPAVPRYRDLPESQLPGYRHCWGVFGEGDELGRLNLLTPATVADAAREIRDGTVINLCLPLHLPDPPWGGERETLRHTVRAIDRNTLDDRLDGFHLQASSQWDGFRHIRAGRLGFYGGLGDAEAGPGGHALGIERWVEHGIVGRGVLADVAGMLAARGEPLDPLSGTPIRTEVLQESLATGGVALRPGDILLVRTGWVDAYLAAPPGERRAMSARYECAGLWAGDDLAGFLWDSGVAAVAADNPAVEAVPGDRAVGSLHRRLLALLGFPLGELFDLRELAATCERTGRYSFFFASAPLNLPGAVGSPANAIAVL